MSVSWGIGAMAADYALAHQDRRAAVIGSGVVGLTAARPTAASRLRRHDLRDGGAARRHLEHVACRVHANIGSHRS
mgnify:CR=1 FL=1